MLIIYAIAMTAWNMYLRGNNAKLENDLNVTSICLNDMLIAYEKLDNQIAHGLCLTKLQ